MCSFTSTLLILLAVCAQLVAANICATRPFLQLYDGYFSRGRGHLRDEVQALQSLLRTKGYSVTVDGYFGSGTYSAVRQFQSRSGIGVDGKVGSITWSRLCASTVSPPTTCSRRSIATFRTSAEGRAHIAKWEGQINCPYRDPVGLWTVGVGHLCGNGSSKSACPYGGRCLSNAEVNTVLANDLLRFENGIKSHVTVPMKQNEFDALVSFTFNVGIGAFSGGSVKTYLNSRRYSEVPGRMALYVNAGGQRLQGLVNRRADEARLWNKC